MNQIELNQRTRDLLDRIRHKRKALSLLDSPADLAEAADGQLDRPVEWRGSVSSDLSGCGLGLYAGTSQTDSPAYYVVEEVADGVISYIVGRAVSYSAVRAVS